MGWVITWKNTVVMVFEQVGRARRVGRENREDDQVDASRARIKGRARMSTIAAPMES